MTNNQTGIVSGSLPLLASRHGGNRHERAAALGCSPAALLDLSASLVPFGPPSWLPRALRRAIADDMSGYPDRSYSQLRQHIAAHHQLDPAVVMPGNGAAELFTWIARKPASSPMCCRSRDLLITPGRWLAGMHPQFLGR